MKKLSIEQKKQFQLRGIKGLRKTQRNRAFRRNRMHNHFIVPTFKVKEKKSEVQIAEPIYLKAPILFDISINTNNVIKYIRLVKKQSNNAPSKPVFIDIENVRKIDLGAISMLLLAVTHLSEHGFRVLGNTPKESECQEFFNRCGYLAHMRNLSNKKFEQNREGNSMIEVGGNKYDSEEIGKIIEASIKLLSGKKDFYHPLHSIINEILGNSIEHGYKVNTHWFLNVNFNSTKNILTFVVADNGFGILKTLFRRYSHEYFINMKLLSNQDVLNSAFEKKYSSRHKDQPNRNNGLPLIKRYSDLGYIKNLAVISNKAFLDFGGKNNSKLDYSFSGTFYKWEVDLTCVQSWTQKEDQN